MTLFIKFVVSRNSFNGVSCDVTEPYCFKNDNSPLNYLTHFSEVSGGDDTLDKDEIDERRRREIYYRIHILLNIMSLFF